MNLERIRSIENLHIIFWLLKDTSWMMEWKILGICMIAPTLFIAFFITYITRKSLEIWLNIAVVFWISANSYWMCAEFFHIGEKNMAAIPFGLGFLAVGIYYALKYNPLKVGK